MSDNLLDFNSPEFESKGPVLIFNGGEAGIVECVTEKIVPKTAEDNENSPDFKIYYKDKDGASINFGIYLINIPSTDANYKNNVNKLGKRLKNLWISVMGNDTPMPTGQDVNTIIKQIIQMLAPRFATEVPVRIAVNYGTTVAPKKYLQVRNWSPFTENITLVPQTQLKREKIEVYERVTEDNDSPFSQDAGTPTPPSGGSSLI
jgi:hypothetical protein